jgi:hypothetical protein
MIKNSFYILLFITMINSSCGDPDQQQAENKDSVSYKEGSFGYDLNFLKQHDSVVVLKDGETSQIIVSPKYQAKVFTSTADGNEGLSFGWVNYKAFTAPVDAHMNAYGGENRFWLGPEGGKFSLFFKPGSEMVFENWKTPPPIDTEAWNVTNKSNSSVALQKEMKLINYKGTELNLRVDRSINILDNSRLTTV